MAKNETVNSNQDLELTLSSFIPQRKQKLNCLQTMNYAILRKQQEDFVDTNHVDAFPFFIILCREIKLEDLFAV